MTVQGRHRERKVHKDRKERKPTVEVKKPSDLPKAKKHKPMDSDEDDEVPQNEPGTSSNTQPIQYLCYLSNQVPEEEIQKVDRLPVHKIHRPVQSRPLHKEHRPVPVLRMNPLTTMTSTEKENLAKQYRVHGVMTQRRTVFYPDLHVLTNDEHWSHFVPRLRKTENNRISAT